MNILKSHYSKIKNYKNLTGGLTCLKCDQVFLERPLSTLSKITCKKCNFQTTRGNLKIKLIQECNIF